MPEVGAPVPRGGIIIWSGKVSAIPSGWLLCNGSNGTPNLTDRFVIHADSDSGGTNDVGDTGGAKTHTLITSEMPAHKHTWTTFSSGGGGGAEVHNQSQTPTVRDTSTVGGGGAHNNRDKFYALAYIMKT